MIVYVFLEIEHTGDFSLDVLSTYRFSENPGLSQNIDFHLDRWDPEGTGIHLRGYGQDLHALRGGLQSEGDVAQT